MSSSQGSIACMDFILPLLKTYVLHINVSHYIFSSTSCLWFWNMNSNESCLLWIVFLLILTVFHCSSRAIGSGPERTEQGQWQLLVQNYCSVSVFKQLFIKNTLLIMLLQLSHFPPFIPLHPAYPLTPTFHLFCSCPWVILISSLATTFPILFLPSPCLFSTYHLCYLFSVPFPLSPSPAPLLITLPVISISVALFLF